MTDGLNIVNLPLINVYINNTPPYFDKPLYNFTILVGSYTKYHLPAYFDPEQNPKLTFVNVTAFPSFVIFNWTSLEFMFMPTSADGNSSSFINFSLFDGYYTTNASFRIDIGVPVPPAIIGH